MNHYNESNALIKMIKGAGPDDELHLKVSDYLDRMFVSKADRKFDKELINTFLEENKFFTQTVKEFVREWLHIFCEWLDKHEQPL